MCRTNGLGMRNQRLWVGVRGRRVGDYPSGNRTRTPECKVCGTVVPDGYIAIRHAFTEHSRAEYVRAYGADSADVREREALLEEIEDVADLEAIATELKR